MLALRTVTYCTENEETPFLDDLAPSLPHGTVCFGHGIWIGMVAWQLLGFSVDGQGMRQFRRFQSGLPLPNGAVYALRELAVGAWSIRLSTLP